VAGGGDMIPAMMDPLSNDSKLWRLNAEYTLNAATYLFTHHDETVAAFPASLLGHHALEMLIKSALIEAGIIIDKVTDKNGKLKNGYAWGHNLRELSQKLAEKSEDFKPVLQQELHRVCDDSPKHADSHLDTFDAYFKEFRYPKTPENGEGLKGGDIVGGLETGELLIQLFHLIRPFAFQLHGSSHTSQV
jgi:HEPN domain-containing protein